MSSSVRVRYAIGALNTKALPRAGVGSDAAGAGACADFSVRRWGAVSMQRQQDARIQRLSGQTMGTHWSLCLSDPEFGARAPVQQLVQEVLDEVIAQMSNWEVQSVISRFNRSAAGSAHELPPEFVRVLQAALHWASMSGGALDPTMGALVSLWGFGPRADALEPHAVAIPARDEIAVAKQRSGFDKLQWTEHERYLIQPGGLELDLCGIAKGFAADDVVERLQQAGWSGGLFEIGGELRSWGERPDGKAWQIQLGSGGVDSGESGHSVVVPMNNGALATSGDYWHHFSVDGKRYSHTLDPRKGWPIEHQLASVTVYHNECMHADALATVLTVLGVQDGMAFATQHDIAAVFYERVTQSQLSPLIWTPAWKARFSST